MTDPKKIFKDGYFWLSIIAGGAVLSMTLWFSFGTDQSIYAYSAWVWKTYHLPPYIGSWNHNWPGSHLLHRLAAQIFGTSVFSFHLFDFLAQLSGLAVIYYLARRLSGKGIAGLLASIFYAIYYFQLGFTKTDEKEGYVFWLLLLAVFFSVSLARRVYFRAVLAGLLAGFAFLVKPTFGLCWPVFGIWFLAEGFRERPKKVWLELLLFGISCLVPALLVIFYYWRLNYLSELYHATIWFNFEVYSKMIRVAPFERIKQTILMLWQLAGERPLTLFPALFAALFALANWKTYPEKKLALIIFSLMIVSLLSILIQGKNFLYYWIPFWGLTMILSGAGLAWIGERLIQGNPGWRSKFISGTFYLVLIFIAAITINTWSLKFAIRFPFRSLRPAYLEQSDTNFLVADYLRPMLKPGDEIELVGWNPIPAFLLRKKLPSRFACFETLLFRRWDGKVLPRQEQWMAEYTREVIRARPRFFLISTFNAPEYLGGIYHMPEYNLKQALALEFPDLQQFLLKNYQLLKTIGTFEIYQRSSE